MYKRFLLNSLVILHIFFSSGFIHQHKPLYKQCSIMNSCNRESRERLIYKNYLVGLRKTRRYITNSSNINSLVSIINFTNNFITNYTTPATYINNSTYINNTETIVKNIMMGNIILDVSNVKHIHITTSQDKIILELDKFKKNDVNFMEQINNLDSLLSTISILGKIMNIN